MALKHKDEIDLALKQVHLRLFEKDVEELQRQAQIKGLPWQTYFRSWLREKLREQKEIQ